MKRRLSFFFITIKLLINMDTITNFDSFINQLGNLYESCKDSMHKVMFIEEGSSEYDKSFELLQQIRDLSATYAKHNNIECTSFESTPLDQIINKGLTQEQYIDYCQIMSLIYGSLVKKFNNTTIVKTNTNSIGICLPYKHFTINCSYTESEFIQVNIMSDGDVYLIIRYFGDIKLTVSLVLQFFSPYYNSPSKIISM